MDRLVEPELLDFLAPDDPRAIGARRGLRRVNIFMGNARIISRALRASQWHRPVRRLVDLGAGDGSFTWQIARRLAPDWPNVSVEVVDRQDLLTLQMRQRFQKLGWNIEAHKTEVMDWLSADGGAKVDCIMANLFLHHFQTDSLRLLLQKIALRANCFVACDPLRSERAVMFCPLLWMLGCNSVVRSDAAISIRAGFVGRELTALWPNHSSWRLNERQAGPFSHLFVAHRN